MAPNNDLTDQSQSSEDTATTRPSSVPLRDQESQSTVAGINSPSSTASASPSSVSHSVINYVGKVQKQSCHRSTVRCRTPYDRQTPSRISRVESVDDTTNSSAASSVDYCSASLDSASLVEDIAVMADLDEATRAGDQNQFQQRQHHQSQEQQQQQLCLNREPRRRRSLSVSSSGCSSSMDDRICDFSPLDSTNSCRCTSLSTSDFDDDGFREDASMSSTYSVFSSSRSYQPHHQLHHNHQNIPHHPNNTKGLFDIALKTVKLIRRNQELQMRLAQLQEETKAFIASVMANPENESLRSQFQTTGGSLRTGASPATVVVQK